MLFSMNCMLSKKKKEKKEKLSHSQLFLLHAELLIGTVCSASNKDLNAHLKFDCFRMPNARLLTSVLLESVLEVCGLAASCEESGSEAEFWLLFVGLLMCSKCKTRPCILHPFSSFTAVSADWGPLNITMANLQNIASC